MPKVKRIIDRAKDSADKLLQSNLVAENLTKQLHDSETNLRYWKQVAERCGKDCGDLYEENQRLRSAQAIDEATLIKQRERLIRLTVIRDRALSVIYHMRAMHHRVTEELNGTIWVRQSNVLPAIVAAKSLETEICALEVDDAIPQDAKKSA